MAVVAPLPDRARDARLGGAKAVHALTLTYKFEQLDKGKVTPRALPFQGVLYETCVEGPLYQVFDANKQLVGFGDMYSPKTHSLKKGAHTLRVFLRHDECAVLDTLKDSVVQLERALDKEVALPLYAHRNDALVGGKKFASRKLNAGERAVVYIAAPTHAQLPKGAAPGDTLVGCVQLDSGVKKSASFPLAVTVSVGGGEKCDKNDEAVAPAAAVPAFNLAESLRDHQIKFLASLKDEAAREEAFAAIAPALLTQFPAHLPLLELRLKQIDERADRAARLHEVVAHADALIAQIDANEVAAYFGRRHHEVTLTSEAGASAAAAAEAAEAAALKRRMEERRATLREALFRKARALADMAAAAATAQAQLQAQSSTADAVAPLVARHERAFAELKSWLSEKEEAKLPRDYAAMQLAADRRQCRWGIVLKALNEQIATEGESAKLCAERIGAFRMSWGYCECYSWFFFILSVFSLFACETEVLKELGWPHWVTMEQACNLVRFPKSLALF